MPTRYAAAAVSIALLVFSFAATARGRAAENGSTLLAAVKNVSGESDKFRSMMADLNAAQIHLVNVQNVMTGSESSAYKAALRKNQSQIADLRDTLNTTTVTGTDGVLITLKKLLLQKNVTVNQVIGVYVHRGGQITVFYE